MYTYIYIYIYFIYIPAITIGNYIPSGVDRLNTCDQA